MILRHFCALYVYIPPLRIIKFDLSLLSNDCSVSCGGEDDQFVAYRKTTNEVGEKNNMRDRSETVEFCSNRHKNETLLLHFFFVGKYELPWYEVRSICIDRSFEP